MALDICSQFEQKVKLTGRSDGVTNEVYTDYILETVAQPDLLERYQSFLQVITKKDLG